MTDVDRGQDKESRAMPRMQQSDAKVRRTRLVQWSHKATSSVSVLQDFWKASIQLLCLEWFAIIAENRVLGARQAIFYCALYPL